MVIVWRRKEMSEKTQSNDCVGVSSCTTMPELAQWSTHDGDKAMCMHKQGNSKDLIPFRHRRSGSGSAMDYDAYLYK